MALGYTSQGEENQQEGIRRLKGWRGSSGRPATPSDRFEEASTSSQKPTLALSPKKEQELIQRWQKDRDQQAALHLIRAYRGLVRAEVRRFAGFGVPKEDLTQEAWEGFFEAVGKFNPQKGARLKTYAHFQVRRRLIEVCAKELGLGDDGRRAFKTTLDAYEELAQELVRLPTRREVVERAASRLLKPGPHRNVEEVLDALERQKLPLWEEWEEDEEEEVGVVVPSPGPGPEETLISNERIHELCQSARHFLGETQGQKWIIWFVLKELEEVKENEMVNWLKEPNCPAHHFWPNIYERFSLNGYVPGSWQEIQRLFATPPPTLIEGNLRQWYWRAKKPLIKAGVLPPQAF
ncbi:MAG: sigma-70 family RNA polymerase sigma factor [Anaerolineae bacterium]|nr:sigma-70 family RNA polymerase sigma factor [Anaerolineae bacterium]MDW8100775.1 sigma-70 family RNA polymerase sigma factor [Anaerolineae bacterium]